MQIFHYNRRDLFSKVLMDIFKLTLVASCVSGFFQNFNGITRISIFAIIGITGILGLIICPPKKEA